MNSKNKGALEKRVVKAAEAALAAQGYASAIDVLVGIGWLAPGTVEEWRRGQIDCLERPIQTNPPRIAQALTLFRAWATAKGLNASEADYLARRPQRQTLRFGAFGVVAFADRCSGRRGWPALAVEPAQTA